MAKPKAPTTSERNTVKYERLRAVLERVQDSLCGANLMISTQSNRIRRLEDQVDNLIGHLTRSKGG